MGVGKTIMRIAKLRHAAALALVILVSSCTDMSTINAATQRAEAARQRALAAEARAEQSTELAAQAYKSTRTADGVDSRWRCNHKNSGCIIVEGGTAQESVIRANDAVSRFESAKSN
jgi:hypothetical protein